MGRGNRFQVRKQMRVHKLGVCRTRSRHRLQTWLANMVKTARSLVPIQLETFGIAYPNIRMRSSSDRDPMGVSEDATNRAFALAIPSPDVDCRSLNCESLLSDDAMQALYGTLQRVMLPLWMSSYANGLPTAICGA